jgi:hypothetical protein
MNGWLRWINIFLGNATEFQLENPLFRRGNCHASKKILKVFFALEQNLLCRTTSSIFAPASLC